MEDLDYIRKQPFDIYEKLKKYHKALSEIANCSEQGNPIYLKKIAREVLEDG